MPSSSPDPGGVPGPAALNLRVAGRLKARVQAYGADLGLSDNAAAITLIDLGLAMVEARRTHGLFLIQPLPQATTEAERDAA